MMDFERICWENAERRRFAEEVDRAAAAETWQRRAEKVRAMYRYWAQSMRIGKSMVLGLSAVLALIGEPWWAATGGVTAALLLYLEVDFREKGREDGH